MAIALIDTSSRGCLFLFTYVNKYSTSFLYDCISYCSKVCLQYQSDITPALDCHMSKPNNCCTRCNAPIEVKHADTCFDCSTAIMLGIAEVDDQFNSIIVRFTKANLHIKACHELLDSIASEPFMPSYRNTQFAHISDKLNNIQENMYTLQKNLAHLG